MFDGLISLDALRPSINSDLDSVGLVPAAFSSSHDSACRSVSSLVPSEVKAECDAGGQTFIIDGVDGDSSQ